MGGIHTELFSLAESDPGIENKQLSKRMQCSWELMGRIPECFWRRGSSKPQACRAVHINSIERCILGQAEEPCQLTSAFYSGSAKFDNIQIPESKPAIMFISMQINKTFR